MARMTSLVVSPTITWKRASFWSILHVLGAEAENRGVDVAGLERGQRRVGIGDEAVGHAIELGQAL